MSINYLRMAATATRLIKANGKPITVNRTVDGEYDPISGDTSSTTSSNQSYAVQTEYKSSEIDGTLILQGDAKFMCIPTVEIRKGDSITCDTGTWRVVESKPKNPGGTVIDYEVQARR